jgi:hypothetical protein
MHLARNRADTGFKSRGAVGGPRLVAFTSEHAHYSYLKAATMTGLGSDNLVVVPCDGNGAMLPSGLPDELILLHHTWRHDSSRQILTVTDVFLSCSVGTSHTGSKG